MPSNCGISKRISGVALEQLLDVSSLVCLAAKCHHGIDHYFSGQGTYEVVRDVIGLSRKRVLS